VANVHSRRRGKKGRFTIMVVPNEAGGSSKTYRFPRWQILILAVSSVVVVLTAFVLAMIYTPLGQVMPIPNPELERKYGEQLVDLNRRMNAMMEQLVELRMYNVKLRNALGEIATATDSGIISSPRVQEPSPQDLARQERTSQPDPGAVSFAPGMGASFAAMVVGDEGTRFSVAFPAMMPTQGYVTRGYDPEGRHFGIDIAGKTGTPVTAGADGYVVFAGWTYSDGHVLILSHSGGFLTYYKHNQSLLKTANTFARQGEPIALLGNSGQASSGPHLHFEIWKDGAPVDPARYLLQTTL
jgi:murein DD-endopeptidase MepM/ murein hydrolase activator NlpD